MSMEKNNDTFWLRREEAPIMPAPATETGVRGWLWHNIFYSMTRFHSVGEAIKSLLMIVLTFGLGWLIVMTFWKLLDFTVLNAVFTDPDGLRRAACLTEAQGGALSGEVGACWPYVEAKFRFFIYGFFPEEELWRPNVCFALLGLGLLWLMLERTPGRRVAALLMLCVYPLVAFVLLTGGNMDMDVEYWTIGTFIAVAVALLAGTGQLGEPGRAFAPLINTVAGVFAAMAVIAYVLTRDFGLEPVPTNNWGGLLVTLVVALTGIVLSLPLGILLALGRRSELPILRWLSILFIEFWRGVPLITVLFMAAIMLPMFLENGADIDNLLRALIGVALFASAYMAEVIRGGLQAVPKGQYEGASAMGLTYSQSMRLIILPQALKISIPGIVNTFIGLFKDTTLVLIIGLFDLLGSIQSSFTDSNWATPVTKSTGYLFAVVIFFLFCFGMSRYSLYLERKLDTGHKS